MNNPVGWFEIYVQDMDRAKKFYETVLGVSLMHLESPTPGLDMWSFPMVQDKPGASGALVKMEGAPSGHNSVLIYFSCDNCATEESRVEAAGGKVHSPKMSIGAYGFISLILDPDGNMFGLHSHQ